MKKISILVLVNLLFAVIFSVLNICFAADVSCLAFVISAGYSAVVLHFLGFHFLKNKSVKKVFVSRKLLQYEPYVFLIAFIARRAGVKGTAFSFDLVSVLIWLVVFVSANILSRWFDPKHFNKVSSEKIEEVKNESLGKMFAKGKKRDGSKVTNADYAKWLLFEILDWGDALLQAVFLVLLFQIFFFQFYKIPTESMVPEYMVNDRVAVSKINCGPKFPLSDVGLPCLKDYDRGDIVVFRNPHYTIDRKSEVKTVVSQLVYMLTFTMVNTNLDEHGQIKADPLVKRITGVAGEQLMMQDGVLYARTKGNDQFVPVKQDGLWATYNLNAENPEVKKYIQDFVVSEEIYQEFIDIEEERNSLDVSAVMEECKNIADQFSNYIFNKKSSDATDDELIKMFSDADLLVTALTRDYSTFAQTLMTVDNGSKWFNAFMTDWTDKYEGLVSNGHVGSNLYEDCSYKLNLMYKLCFGKLCLISARSLYNQIPTNKWKNSLEVVELENKIRMLHNYICFMDRRNMPVFPENDADGNPQYIPENCYFMMGDNRFNSFDMRHTDLQRLEKLSAFDNFAITYFTNMKPMYVPKKLILGATGIRFWPMSRPERTKRTIN